eukprot:TRINITY_DN339_c0_g2_i3.p1 TRINITY_DN339_c0_g2~~TRINITY_DN339_c0_g2_i3.p1  ORF type:complete len:169 (-),score=37.43 TRINITY_DN339_c0_g2_i3:45-551(-)
MEINKNKGTLLKKYRENLESLLTPDSKYAVEDLYPRSSVKNSFLIPLFHTNFGKNTRNILSEHIFFEEIDVKYSDFLSEIQKYLDDDDCLSRTHLEKNLNLSQFKKDLHLSHQTFSLSKLWLTLVLEILRSHGVLEYTPNKHYQLVSRKRERERDTFLNEMKAVFSFF